MDVTWRRYNFPKIDIPMCTIEIVPFVWISDSEST